LIESRPQLSRIPDQSIVINGQGQKGEYICATRDTTGSFIMVYIPLGKMITLNASSIKSKKIFVWWFNPKTADVLVKGLILNKQNINFTCPTVGFENDWVLVIDNPKYKYKIPFQKRNK
jgi:hypothetical protein